MNIRVVSASAGSGKTYRLTEILYERIAAGEVAVADVAMDGAEAVALRLNRVRQESAACGRSLLDGVEFNDFAALDPAELEHRALRLPGDRIRGVADALGEIVAYVEFELKNHPKIDDSAPFLEAVDPLRAMLVR